MLFAATIAMGGGIAVMQPALPPLVRAWLPDRIGFATATYTNGLLIGEIVAVSLTLPLVLPWGGGSWRIAIALWSLPVIVIALLVALLSAPRNAAQAAAPRRRWWPSWRDGRIWQLGILFGSVNSIYFSANAFLPEYLTHAGTPELIGGALDGAQFRAAAGIAPDAGPGGAGVGTPPRLCVGRAALARQPLRHAAHDRSRG